MIALHALPLVAQVLLPIVLLAWQAGGRSRSRATALVKTLFIAAYLVAIALVGLWLIVPWFLSVVYLLLFAVATMPVTRRMRSRAVWPENRRGNVGLAVGGTLAIAAVGLVCYALAGRRPPSGPIVDLAFPLRDGTYAVANGGSNELVSAHMQTLSAERFRNFRGQSYGVDIIAVSALGLRASGVAPRDPSAYVIFGETIYSPCGGTVLRVEDGVADMSPPEVDRQHMAGNFAFLHCKGVQVLVGHMRRGSVRVQSGDSIAEGDVIGQVGNSGNTSEPHLHIHAQRPAENDAFLSGEPLPIRLNGRFLVRNDLLR